MVSEEIVRLQYESEDDFIEILPNTNVVLAGFTTAHARLKLYSYLGHLQTNVLYYDTDSIIYIDDGRITPITTGNYLGDLTDELAKDFGEGSYITRFVSGGPTQYSNLSSLVY